MYQAQLDLLACACAPAASYCCRLLSAALLLPQATEALRITGSDLVKFGIMDEIVPEPLGGAHADPVSAFPYIKDQLMATYNYYSTMTPEEIMLDRWAAGQGWGPAQPCMCRQHLADASALGISLAERLQACVQSRRPCRHVQTGSSH